MSAADNDDPTASGFRITFNKTVKSQRCDCLKDDALDSCSVWSSADQSCRNWRDRHEENSFHCAVHGCEDCETDKITVPTICCSSESCSTNLEAVQSTRPIADKSFFHFTPDVFVSCYTSNDGQVKSNWRLTSAFASTDILPFSYTQNGFHSSQFTYNKCFQCFPSTDYSRQRFTSSSCAIKYQRDFRAPRTLFLFQLLSLLNRRYTIDNNNTIGSQRDSARRCRRRLLRSALNSSHNFFCALLVVSTAAFFGSSLFVAANRDAARLFEDLLADYNKLVRPVDNNTATLVVKFKLKLSQLLDVHEKQQIMTTNVWLQHSWADLKLRWDPKKYGGVDVLYVPSEMIWLPDIVLYNNADGNYQVTIMTKAKLTYDGTVEWTPPAIYKRQMVFYVRGITQLNTITAFSMCQINIEWFPFDTQTCEMKFGSWTYGGLEVDLKHKDEHLQREELEQALGIDGEYNETVWVVDAGIDLSDYYPSVEWDILRIPGKRHEKRYPCCESPFIDLTYEIYLRRKTLFYTVNLMIPCVGISFLTALVFYLPSDGGEKISLCISILISLTVFFLLLVEIIPSTSLVIPLIGKYLLFTMVLVTLSVIVTVITLNVHYRAPATHKMSPWMRKVFIEVLPYYLLMRRPLPLRGHILSPKYSNSSLANQILPVSGGTVGGSANFPRRRGTFDSFNSTRFRERNLSTIGEQMDLLMPPSLVTSTVMGGSTAGSAGGGGSCSGAESIGDRYSQLGSFQHEETPIRSAVDSVMYISQYFRKEQEDQQVIEDWKYVSVVMDRIFLILFTLVCFIGTGQIIFCAPTIYDSSEALA